MYSETIHEVGKQAAAKHDHQQRSLFGHLVRSATSRPANRCHRGFSPKRGNPRSAPKTPRRG